MSVKKHRYHSKKRKISVIVKQASRASTGQGGNAFAINASDVGVVRTEVRPS